MSPLTKKQRLEFSKKLHFVILNPHLRLKNLKALESVEMFRLRLNMTRFHVSLRASVTSVAINNHGIPTMVDCFGFASQ
ncbi:MAG: hypothetical protein K2N70_08185 [Helicobacter sp.]|nr:hypothetical protein [Helicobacter sp.]